MPDNHKLYDEAHSHEQNCTEKYSRCNHSIWDASFMF